MKTFNEAQQKAFADGNWAWTALPKWARAVTFIIGLPAFVALIYLVFAGEERDSPRYIAPGLAFAGVCLLQVICAMRAFQRLGRND